MKFTSQWSQDRLLYDNFFSKQDSGIFIDVGAHNGIELSNTYFLNEHAKWNGICIEPIKDRYDELVKNRPNCIPINACVYNHNGSVPFTEISGYSEMLSGITETYADDHKKRIDYELKLKGGDAKEMRKKCYTLETICRWYGIEHVNYLTVDTEGSELEILEGLGSITVDVIDVEENYEEDGEKIKSFLTKRGYKIWKKIGGDVIYIL